MMTRRRQLQQRRGAMTALVAFMLVIMLVLGGIAVDVAYVQLVNTQLRKVADAASHAGSESLARLQDVQAAYDAAQAVALQNSVMGAPYALDLSDIQLGHSEYAGGAWQFSAGGENPNSVRVTTDLQPNGFLTTLSRLTGVESIDVEQRATSAHTNRDICFVLDRSGSMAFDMSGVEWSYPPGRDYCSDPHPSLSRWAKVVAATNVFLDEIEDTPQVEKVSLVTYSSRNTSCGWRCNASDINNYLTQNYGEVRSDLTWLSNRAIPGGTAISAGIDHGVVTLMDSSRNRQFSDKMIVLLTDGHENSGRSSLSAADDAAALGIRIHTITFSTGADIERMTEVANRTGGRHFNAPDAEALTAIFLQIARGIPIVMTE